MEQDNGRVPLAPGSQATPSAAGASSPNGADPSRKIPETWFRAQTSATTMGFLIPRENSGQERFAPLGEGERKLGWFVLPPFQRPPVWSREQQSRFVESCWMGLPIGAIVYNRANNYRSRFDNWLLDGQQRVTALLGYMADAFPVFGHRFSELTDIDHTRWSLSCAFPTLVMQSENEAELADVYDRLAYGGTPHAPRDSDASLAEDPTGLSGEAVAARADRHRPDTVEDQPL